MIATLWRLWLLFAGLSLLAFGGGNGVIPEMQRAAVQHGWMTRAEFLDAFAISRAAPGPGSLIVVLVGQKAAGLPGALVAALGMYVPACALVYAAARAWRRFEAQSWRHAAERALAPVAVGLTYGSGLALLRDTEHGTVLYVITAASTAVLALTELNPLPVMAAGALLAVLL